MTQTIETVGDVMLREIIASPHDKALRRIFSDWLIDREDRHSRHWAELIQWGGSVPLSNTGTDWVLRMHSYPGVYPPDRMLNIAKSLTIHSVYPCEAVEYRHGFIEVVRAPFDVLVKGLPQWVTEYPLTAVEVSDRQPMRHHTTNIESFSWTWDDNFNARCRIPRKVWQEVLKVQTMLSDGLWAAFNTPEEAIKALSDTLLDMARRRVL